MSKLLYVMLLICVWAGLGAWSIVTFFEMVMFFVLAIGSISLMDNENMTRTVFCIIMLLAALVMLALVLFALPGVVFQFAAGTVLTLAFIIIVGTPIAYWCDM